MLAGHGVVAGPLAVARKAYALMGGGGIGTAGLVSWWSLDEASGTRADSHGTNHLAESGAIASATGKVGDAADFEAADSRQLSVADNAALSEGSNGAYTVGFWIKPESLVDDAGPMGKWNPAGAGSEWALVPYSSAMLFACRNSSDTQVNLFSSVTMSTATWYFVMAWYDPADSKLRIQVDNGTVDASGGTLSGGIRDGTNDFIIGRYHSSGSYWDGLVDEVFIAKRVYTADEREWLYNSGAGRAYSEL